MMRKVRVNPEEKEREEVTENAVNRSHRRQGSSVRSKARNAKMMMNIQQL